MCHSRNGQRRSTGKGKEGNFRKKRKRRETTENRTLREKRKNQEYSCFKRGNTEQTKKFSWDSNSRF